MSLFSRFWRGEQRHQSLLPGPVPERAPWWAAPREWSVGKRWVAFAASIGFLMLIDALQPKGPAPTRKPAWALGCEYPAEDLNKENDLALPRVRALAWLCLGLRRRDGTVLDMEMFRRPGTPALRATYCDGATSKLPDDRVLVLYCAS
jgi:hypothetical protein